MFSREDAHELPPGVNQLVRVYVAQKRKISEGDKLAGRHGNKGVISKILPVEDMPFLADGTPVDIILNPLGVPSRMNVGQVLELPPRLCRRGAGRAPVVDGLAPLRGTVTQDAAATDPAVWVSTPVFDGAHWDEEGDAGKHPTIQQIFRPLNSDTANGGVREHEDGKATLYNGRTGEAYDNAISVGFVYILEVGTTWSTTRSTPGRPVRTRCSPRGPRREGPVRWQRFGEMEVWALKGYGGAYALQELLTIKSDGVLGRVKVYEAIVKGENIPQPAIPESFKVLIKEIQSLCLHVEVFSHHRDDSNARAGRGRIPDRRGAGYRHQPCGAWV